jgi:hypothetical protein
MSQNQKVKLYGIEAELPPGCPVTRLDTSGEPYLCQPSGDPILYCYTAGPIEIFASVAECRWSDIILAGQDDASTSHAERQAALWHEIREAAIKEQKP